MTKDAPHHESTALPSRDVRQHPPLWLAMLLTAMAGGLGWGIRGQYGHETGAMIAGLLVGLVLVFLFCPQGTSLSAARAVALATVAISFGGSMTYGQTVGLTHDAPLVGNWAALRWGLLGLFIKGGIWIGFAGVFLGMGLSGRRYRPRDLALLLGAMAVLLWLGMFWLNEPFDPAHRVLPRIYFSDDWRWEPGADLKPRRERWGGLLLALAGALVYAGWLRRDRLARNLGLWGVLGGGVGFSLGQCVQAFHAWNLELFRSGWLAKVDPVINWWNMMETSFGAIFGAVLALGLWLNRGRITLPAEPEPVSLSPTAEGGLVLLHAAALIAWSFFSVSAFEAVADFALTMGAIPILAVAAGRYWPYLLTLPMVALPIAGKTLRQLCYQEGRIAETPGWIWYGILPVLATTVAAVVFARRTLKADGARVFTRWALLGTTWLYFGLNFAFFHFPWPWEAWTSRTANGIIYTLCAVGLSVAALGYERERHGPRDSAGVTVPRPR